MALNSEQSANTRFYELLWPLRAEVLRMARILSGNDSDAEELAQETLLKAAAALDSLEDGADARAWLIRILRNAWIDRIGSPPGAQTSIEEKESTESIDDWRQPDQVFEGFSNHQIINALQELPEEIRLTLLLVDVQQMDDKEAADTLDVPVATIKSNSRRGRMMLRQALSAKARDLKVERAAKR